jgi:hypothetical protein
MCEELCKRSTTKFCSQKCANRYRSENKLRRGGPKKKLTNKECLYCKKIFSPIRQTSKFCSHVCAGKYRFHIKKETSFNTIGVARMKKLSPQDKAKYAKSVEKARKFTSKYTKGIGGTRKDLGHYVRSRWEANICRWLKYLNINYYYEKDSFVLLDGITELIYTPDLKIFDNIYIEIKGWETDNSIRKRKLMPWQHPHVSIMYITEAEYKKISKEFKDIIPEWEYDTRHGR